MDIQIPITFAHWWTKEYNRIMHTFARKPSGKQEQNPTDPNLFFWLHSSRGPKYFAFCLKMQIYPFAVIHGVHSCGNGHKNRNNEKAFSSVQQTHVVSNTHTLDNCAFQVKRRPDLSLIPVFVSFVQVLKERFGLSSLWMNQASLPTAGALKSEVRQIWTMMNVILFVSTHSGSLMVSRTCWFLVAILLVLKLKTNLYSLESSLHLYELVLRKFWCLSAILASALPFHLSSGWGLVHVISSSIWILFQLGKKCWSHQNMSPVLLCLQRYIASMVKIMLRWEFQTQSSCRTAVIMLLWQKVFCVMERMQTLNLTQRVRRKFWQNIFFCVWKKKTQLPHCGPFILPFASAKKKLVTKLICFSSNDIWFAFRKSFSKPPTRKISCSITCWKIGRNSRPVWIPHDTTSGKDTGVSR